VPWMPSVPGEIPTLGWTMIDWYAEYLASPDDPDGGPLVLTREQEDFVLRWYSLTPTTGRFPHHRGLLGRPRGWGKALALDTPLPTPHGWVTVGSVAVGDVVFGSDGQPCNVVGKSQIWYADTYRVSFSDGAEIVASGDHLWVVRDRNRIASETLTTRELVSRGVMLGSSRGRAEYRFRVAMTGPLALPDADLLIDPYVLGVWLGDGDSDAGRITCHPHDCEIVDHLRGIGVLNNKHIPGGYLRGSAAQRLALLQGLMDTDGSIYDRGTCEFTTTSPRLRDGVEELLASLGIKFRTYESDAILHGKACGRKWRTKFTAHADTPVFRLARKWGRQRSTPVGNVPSRTRRIVAVTPVETMPTQCIEVDSADRTFLAGRQMVPTHNSPILGAAGLGEGLGPVLFDGWDADGQPVGKPWSEVRRPLIHVAAVSEAQTKNTWDAILAMCAGPVLDAYPGTEPFDTFINFPIGQMTKVTASARTLKGARTVLGIMDQTEEWVPSNGGIKLAQVMRTNAAKVGGRTLESPNAFIPGEGSVAEESAAYAAKILEGKTRLDGLLYDHREAPADTDLTDRDSLIAGLRFAYGCSSDHPDGCVLHDPPCKPGWAPIESNADMFWDPANDVQRLRSDFLNQITHASDSWITRPEWNACSAAVVEPSPPSPSRGDVITLGFDGSRKRSHGKTDSTALVACRISDGYTWIVGLWEEPDGPEGADWRVPSDEVDAVVRETFATFRVVGFYADPARWEGYVAGWEARFGVQLRVKATRMNPIEWWMTGGNRSRVTKALNAFLDAVLDGEMCQSGDARLARHILNARRRTNPTGYGIYKQHPDSPDKIDAAIAAVLAWQARLDAVAAGAAAPPRRRRSRPRRLY